MRPVTRPLPFLGLAVLTACTAYLDVNATAAATSGDTDSTSSTSGPTSSTSGTGSTDGETAGTQGSTAPTEGPTTPTCTKTGDTDETKCPETCAEVLVGPPGAADGAYALYAGSDPARPWQAWCVDMDATPREYLILAVAGSGFNFSQFVPGPEQQGTTVRTTYLRVRIDPHDFLVDISDQRFSTSTGQLTHGRTEVTSMPYGVAMACTACKSAGGRGNIDLRGTPFTVSPEQYIIGGWEFTGATIASSNNQVLDLVAGGCCGYITPAPIELNVESPFNGWGGFLLQLEYVQ